MKPEPLIIHTIETTRIYGTRADGEVRCVTELLELLCHTQLSSDSRSVEVSVAQDQGFTPKPMRVWLKGLPADLREPLTSESSSDSTCTLQLVVGLGSGALNFYGIWSPQEKRCAAFFVADQQPLMLGEAA